jgi:hypothetical protein
MACLKIKMKSWKSRWNITNMLCRKVDVNKFIDYVLNFIS